MSGELKSRLLWKATAWWEGGQGDLIFGCWSGKSGFIPRQFLQNLIFVLGCTKGFVWESRLALPCPGCVQDALGCGVVFQPSCQRS